MQHDHQHLDFLISQHVDGSLDAAGKKSVEQRLLTDPEARKLYQEHREVQDVLDDWGSRIPMINWEDFDRKLAGRLEKETVGTPAQRTPGWWKPVAAAAALFVAAWGGYAWHAISGNGSQTAVATVARPAAGGGFATASVKIDDNGSAPVASSARFRVDDSPMSLGAPEATASNVSVAAPGDVAASEALRDAVMSGLSHLSNMANIDSKPGSASAMNGFEKPNHASDDAAAPVDRDAVPPLP
ncbi:MAG TPA: hypothetical protein VHQ47_03115 [Phycisphaerae bacterium]|nr:hypothetical protein [Phycisphaerae bacterium]